MVPTGTTYPVLLSGNQVGSVYGTSKENYLVIDGSGTCTYRVNGYNQAGVENALDEVLATSNVPGDRTSNPDNFQLEQNYPNPFNSQTVIRFQLDNKESQAVLLKIYDLQGREVTTLVNENLAAGVYTVNWNGRDYNNQPVTSGIFYYMLQVNDRKEMKKMTLVR